MVTTTKQTLKLKSNTLTLKTKASNVEELKKAYASSTNKVAVDVKRGKCQNSIPSSSPKISATSSHKPKGMTAEEIEKRLSLVQNSNTGSNTYKGSIYKTLNKAYQKFDDNKNSGKTADVNPSNAESITNIQDPTFNNSNSVLQKENISLDQNKDYIDSTTKDKKHLADKDEYNTSTSINNTGHESKVSGFKENIEKSYIYNSKVSKNTVNIENTPGEDRLDKHPNIANKNLAKPKGESIDPNTAIEKLRAVAKYKKYRDELDQIKSEKDQKNSNNYSKRSSNKSHVKKMLTSEEFEVEKRRSIASVKRAKEKYRRQNNSSNHAKVKKLINITDSTITSSELASLMGEKLVDVTRELLKLGIIGGADYVLDKDTAEMLAMHFGHTINFIDAVDIDSVIFDQKDDDSELQHRPPVVTIMGHVDHGKTSLLDSLRDTNINIASIESGGITQHIGAYQIECKPNKFITFIDTPGHEAFTSMRSRGSKVTDIVILVVAADDGIKPQTKEAISHAKAANVPIIVAINKIDKPDADIEKIKSELLSNEVVIEDFGGDVIAVPISALKKTNLDQLTDAILLISEMLDLKANYETNASGVVLESKIDKNVGPLATLLVQRGTLNKSSIIVAGQSYGKVKRMTDDYGKTKENVTPGTPVEVIGLSEAVGAGEKFLVVDSEKTARTLSQAYVNKLNAVEEVKSSNNIQDLILALDSNVKELRVIIKCDVQGSAEAIKYSLSKIEHNDVKLSIIHCAVGGITESDIALASASQALVIGFNVRASSSTILISEKNNVEIKYYSVIYNLIDDVKSIMSGLLDPIIVEKYIGSAEVREVFNITKVGKVAGSYVTNGIVKKDSCIRLLRDNVVIYEGKLVMLKRFKDNVKEVKSGFECGILLDKFNDIKVGDIIESSEKVSTKAESVK